MLILTRFLKAFINILQKQHINQFSRLSIKKKIRAIKKITLFFFFVISRCCLRYFNPAKLH